MSLFDWTFSFFSDKSGQFSEIAVIFSLLDLLIASFFRIAFNGLLRFRLRWTRLKGGS